MEWHLLKRDAPAGGFWIWFKSTTANHWSVARSYRLFLVLNQELHHMNMIITCELCNAAQLLWTFLMYSVYGRSYNLYSDNIPDNASTRETNIFPLRRNLFSCITASALKEITICRNQLRGNFHNRLHIDANGTAWEETKHELWSAFMFSHNPISFPQAWRWNFAFYNYYKSRFFPLPASLLDISRGINRIKARQLFVLLVQMLFITPTSLTLC